MHLAIILQLTGILLILFSFTFLSPVVVALIYEEATTTEFASAFLITALSGLALWIPFSQKSRELRGGDGFLVTALFYLGLGLFGAIPLYLNSESGLTFSDAAFESMSGLTTTGATVMVGLDALPKSILFYRQQLQWLGGIGIIVLAVAIFPLIGIGGMQLYQTESPGPNKENKLTPRITETARALWLIYVSLTIICALCYWYAGMDVFDAISHSFSTIAIGGFSTHDLSIGYFDNIYIEIVAMIFMTIAGVNFGLHFLVWKRKNLIHYFSDVETRSYLLFLAVGGLLVCGLLTMNSVASATPLRDGLFQTISIATTTGFTTQNFSEWPSGIPFLLLLAAFAGGCAGSTAGGVKIVRVLLIFLQGLREVKRLIHPKGVFPLKLGGAPVTGRISESVWSFISVYILIFLAMVLILLVISDLDFVTAFSAVGACLNNLGPGLGNVAMNYSGLDAEVKWLLMFAMMLGRLEIFTLLVLLTPSYWRR